MKKLITIIAAIAVIVSACERELDVSKVGFKRRLVINALLNDANSMELTVSQSTNIYDSVKPAPITNANVIIKDGKGNITACSYNAATKKYESSAVPVAGERYEMTVTAPGFDPAYATMIVPVKASSGKATWKDSTDVDASGFPTGTIHVKISDQKGLKNYYRINLYYFDPALVEWKTLKPVSADGQLQNDAVKTEDGGWIITDLGFDGGIKDIDFITPFGAASPPPALKFLVVIESLSYDYYRYYKSLSNYAIGTGVFVEPVPVFTNIRNGIGIFAASSLQKDTIK